MRQICETFDLDNVHGAHDLLLYVTVEVEGGYSRPSLYDPGDDPEATITSIVAVDDEGEEHVVPALLWSLVLPACDERRLLEGCIEKAIERADDDDRRR